MSTSSYANARPKRPRKRRPKSGSERVADSRARSRHLAQLMRMAGAMQHGPVSVIVLTCPDWLTRAEWQRIDQRWSTLAAQTGLITWSIGVYHERGPNGRIVRPHVHLICDLHHQARQLLHLHAEHKSPKYRRFDTVKLDQHGLTFGELSHRVGIGHKTHWRILDDGGPGYLHGLQWRGSNDWIYNAQTVNAFIPDPGPPMSPRYAAILDAMRHADTDEQAVKIARRLMTNTNTPATPPQTRPEPHPLPPSAAAARQARLLAPEGILTRWLHDRCDTTIPGSPYGHDRPVMSRSEAIDSFNTYCNDHGHPLPPRRDFPQAMDSIFSPHHGYWDLVTLQANPTTAGEVWDITPPTPPDPNAPPIEVPQMPGMRIPAMSPLDYG